MPALYCARTPELEPFPDPEPPDPEPAPPDPEPPEPEPAPKPLLGRLPLNVTPAAAST
jgi:hypothetical protein